MTTRSPTIGDNRPPALEDILKDRYEGLTKRKKAWLKKAKEANLKPKTEDEIAALEKLFVDGDEIAKEAEKARNVEKEEPLKAGQTIDAFFNTGFRDEIGTDQKRGGLAQDIKKAALTRRAEIAEAEQAKAKEEADRLAKKAAEDEAKAEAARASGNHRMADIHENRADAKYNEAAGAQALANQDLRTASRSSVGGITSSAGRKLVCIGVKKGELDLNALRPFLKDADLIDAVNRMMANGNEPPTGAITELQVVGRIAGKR